MEQYKSSSGAHHIIIRKSLAVLVLRLITFELIIGIVYLLTRLLFEFVGSSVTSTAIIDPVSLFKSFIFIILEIGVASYVILQWLSNYYTMDDNEIRYIRGIISRKEMTYSLKNIQSVSFEQNLIGRILNYGNIRIFSPALQQELFILEVTNPSHIVEKIREIHDNEKHGSRFILRK